MHRKLQRGNGQPDRLDELGRRQRGRSHPWLAFLPLPESTPFNLDVCAIQLSCREPLSRLDPSATRLETWLDGTSTLRFVPLVERRDLPCMPPGFLVRTRRQEPMAKTLYTRLTFAQ